MKRSLLVCLLLLGALALASGSPTLRHRFGTLIGWAEDDAVPSVKVIRVDKAKGQLPVIAGELQPLDQTDVVSPMAGVVKEIRYAVGEKVTAGAVVGVIESKELLRRSETQRRALAEAREELQKTEAELAAAEKRLATVRDWQNKELVARREVDDAEAVLDGARAQLDVAQARLRQRESLWEQTRYLLALTRLTAPSAGVVTRRWVEAGASVAASAKVLSVGNTAAMQMLVPLKREQAAALWSGMTLRCRVDALPTHDLEAELIRLDRSLAPDGTVAAQVRLANRGGLLKAEMKTRCSPRSESEGVVWVPRAAMVDLAGHRYVYTVVRGKALLKAVVAGSEQENRIVITSGLEQGEFVVIAGIERLHPGSPVRVVNESAGPKERSTNPEITN